MSMSTVESTRTGILELHPKGYGYLREPGRNYKAAADDVYVATPMLTRFHLRSGVLLTGRVEPPQRGQGPRLAELMEIEGRDPEQYLSMRGFDDLTAVDPHDRIRLETGAEPLGPRRHGPADPHRQGPARPDRRPPRAPARRSCSSNSPPPSPPITPRCT